MHLKLKSASTWTLGIALVLVFTFQACKSKTKNQVVEVKKIDTFSTSSGLRYIITKANPDGAKAESGDQVEAQYTGKLTDGKIFDSSFDSVSMKHRPFSFVIGQHRVIKGWEEGFELLREGEEATLILPSELAYGSQAIPGIPANSTLIFDVKLVSLKKPMKYEPFSGVGKDTITLPSGLRYIIIDKGNDTLKAKQAKMASVFYAGYLMDGTKFDGNFGTFNPLNLPVVGAGVIEGWKQILPLMNQGMKLRAIIPGNLAYGSRGYPGVIPPDATLIFDMYLDKLN